MGVNNFDCALLEIAREAPCRAKSRKIARWQDHGVRSHGPRLRGEFPIVKEDEHHADALPCEPGDHSQDVALDASEQLPDRADRYASDGRAGQQARTHLSHPRSRYSRTEET
jgi:hypothetical protein